MFSDDIVLVGEYPEEMKGRQKEWREALDGTKLKISMCI